MRIITFPAIAAAALLSAVVSLPFMPFAASRTALYHFDVTVTSSQRGVAQLFYDIGNGIREEDSAHALVDGGGATQTLHFDLPAGRYAALRFDPLDRPSDMTVANATIMDTAGTVVKTFTATDFVADQQITEIKPLNSRQLHLELAKDGNDPITHLKLSEPMNLQPDLARLWPAIRRITVPTFFAIVALLAAMSFVSDRAWRRLRGWVGALAARPGRAVAATAAIAVVASSYPVVFLGKSFVSPNYGVILLYEAFPTLPGYRDSRLQEVKGADVGAVMWQHVPYSMLQSRALAQGELPLWNRYNSAGTPLLAQGQSMFGDPLHFLVIAADGAAWAWDLKYLIAKWLLAAGIGLCVLRLTRHLPSAAIVAAVMPFIGFFVYRVNHPALFSLCYAPWILVCWIGVATSPKWRGAAAWLAGLMLANWTEMNSGTVKEAYMSLLTLNFAGAVVLACVGLPWLERLRRFALAALAGILFALLAAPIWLTFLTTLGQSYTGYNDARAYQVQPSLVLAFFDEILFRPFWEKDYVYNGSVNFVILLGVLAFLVNLRRICTDRIARALAVSAVLPLVIIFGVVPPDWIVHIPFLGNVAHVDNSFFCPLVTLLGVFAGYGLQAMAQRLGKPEGRGDLALGFTLLAVMAGTYVAFGQTVQRSTYSYWHWGEHITRSPFVVGDFIALLLASVGLAWCARHMLVRGRAGRASVLCAITCLLVLLWRHGLQVPTGFSDYVIAPPARVDFHARSAAVEAARADEHGEPWRFVGLNQNAFHGWMNVYGFEGIAGPDALENRYYRELVDALHLTRIWDWRIYSDIATLPAQKRAYDALNVRYYFDYGDNPGLRGLVTPLVISDLAVYRSDTAWPRAFFTDRVASYSDAGAFAKLVAVGDGRPFAAMQDSDLVRENNAAVLRHDLGGRTIIPATKYRLTTNTTSFDVDATGAGVAVLEEAFWPGDFRAYVDGAKVAVLRLNHAFKGVLIEGAGRHHIEFSYVPRGWYRNLALCGTGALLFIVTAFLLYWTRPAENRRTRLGAEAHVVTPDPVGP